MVKMIKESKLDRQSRGNDLEQRRVAVPKCGGGFQIKELAE